MTFRKISLTFLMITLSVCLRIREEAAQVRAGTPFDPGTGSSRESSHRAGKGADQRHQDAHAAGGNLHPGHAPGREAVRSAGGRPATF